ncbi:S46 family peptidase [Sinimarinibacterium sp. CAU 1509]|uniref:S46 family peptidase n=1 Tax=Sinimarinibacterium sp. CAU 1509 TaxID=2562283 RepID=UPI0010AC9798|nr:S46 family peptidase [Sinimarinibacterium sp. CAU 1509]TJY56645.1 S46 family peptidase [Sinimarinibacterium sp. CAU 1509]
MQIHQQPAGWYAPLVLGTLVWICGFGTTARAAEGLWTLDNLPVAQIKAKYGFEPDAGWTERVMQSTVRLASGCSGAFVSADGLVLTNAHCVLDCARELSGGKRDVVNNGFVAHKRDQELACPSAEVNRLDAITDVTASINAATEGLEGRAFVEARNTQIADLESTCVGAESATVHCDVVELYNGGRYALYRYYRLRDVRLVFSPEYRAGFFGGDPDHFNFPRYTFDIGLLRAYENGKPASVAHHLKLNPAGAQPGELTMITGHPGDGERQLTVAQLLRMRDVDLTEYLAYYSEQRGLLWQYSRGSAEAARQAQADLAHAESHLKEFRGELDALLDPALLEQKRAQEEALRSAYKGTADNDPWIAIANAQRRYREIEAPYRLLEGRRGLYSRYFTIARHLVRAAEERAKPNAERLPEYQDASLPRLQQILFSTTPIYPDYEKTKLAWSLDTMRTQLGADDPVVKLVLARESPEVVSEHLVDGTQLGEVAVRQRLWAEGVEAIAKSKDPFIQLARAVDTISRDLRSRYESEVEAVEAHNAATIEQLRLAQFGTSAYPDATSTLRLSYGEVRGWIEKGQAVEPFTTLKEIFDRATGFDPFRLPDGWLAARTTLDLDTRFNFVTTNDVFGDNTSGPVINREAEVVGLAFDGNIHSLSGKFWFDEARSRSVAVHSAAIAEVLTKVYHAESLVQEMTHD